MSYFIAHVGLVTAVSRLMKLWNEYGAPGGLCGIVDKWTANQ